MLTKSTVSRVLFVIEVDEHDYHNVEKINATIALARCPVCGRRCRVLPSDVLPHKRYSLPVIERAVSLYNRGDLSLRNVVRDELYGEHDISHTILHGWTEGLGAYLLGRSAGEVADALPASRVLSDLEAHHPQMSSLRETPLRINPTRHRSEGRRERLEACKRFELYCGVIDAKDGWMFGELNRLILSWSNSCGFGFRSEIRCTAFEQADAAVVVRDLQNAKKEVLKCPIRGRSPTGDTR